jgi:hypothetical protein
MINMLALIGQRAEMAERNAHLDRRHRLSLIACGIVAGLTQV